MKGTHCQASIKITDIKAVLECTAIVTGIARTLRNNWQPHKVG